eukprot:4391445-Lingulodinium_polyedra.AAC.1
MASAGARSTSVAMSSAARAPRLPGARRGAGAPDGRNCGVAAPAAPARVGAFVPAATLRRSGRPAGE